MAASSPYIVERVSPESLYTGRPGSDGLAGFSGIKGSKVRELFGECRQSGGALGDAFLTCSPEARTAGPFSFNILRTDPEPVAIF